MSDSILGTTKVALGVEADDPSFDGELMMFINSAFLELAQIGVGPAAGFMIEDAAATWEQLLGTDANLNAAKSLVHIKVRMLFDPPSNPAVITALDKVAEQLTWRLNVHRETSAWTNPTPRQPEQDEMGNPIIIDGGVG